MLTPNSFEPPELLLARARTLFEQKRFEESLAAHLDLVQRGELLSEGYYGAGISAFMLKMFEDAYTCFQYCVQLDRGNSNAWYYLGEIAAIGGDAQLAGSYYRTALETNPRHTAAARKLGVNIAPAVRRPSVVIPNVPQPNVSARAATRNSPVPLENSSSSNQTGRHGAYRLMQEDETPIGRETTALIESIRLDARPRLSAYLGALMRRAFLVVPGFVIASVRPRASMAIPLFALLALLLILIKIIRIKTMRITMSEGRIKISKGVFRKRVSNIELYRIVDLEMVRTLLHRLTGNGTLVLDIEGKKQLKLTGLAGIGRLREMYDGLRDLVFILRSSSYGKGIIR